MGGGTANRISAYRKSAITSNRGNARDDPVLQRADESDDAGGASGREVRMELDVKETLNNLRAVEQVSEVVNQFEKNYFGAKKKMNGLDQQSLQSDSHAQVLKLNYHIMKSALYNENPSFDLEKME